MLAPILARWCFSPISDPWCKCVEMGFKNPSNVFYSNFVVMRTKRSTQKESISSLKSSEREFCFQRQGSIDGAEQQPVGNCSQPSRTKYSAKVFEWMVRVLRGEIVKLRGSLIAISLSVGLFLELEVCEFKGRTISGGCMRSWITRIV